MKGRLKLTELVFPLLNRMLLPPEKKASADDDYIIAKKKPEPRHDDDTRYIGALTSIELAKTSGKCVLVDPGQRDVLYCMKETSTAKQKEILAFRKTNRSKRPRHFRILGKLTKPSMIKNAETLLSKMQSSTVDLDTFVKYIKTRASVNKILGQYYGNETQKSEEIYFPDS